MERIIYLCDRKACDTPCGECDYTGDINHAINFEKLGDHFAERIPSDDGLKRNGIKVKIEVDSSELDAALEKARELADISMRLEECIASLIPFRKMRKK